ncbi:helical backbone metal receptor [Frankia sp. ACN1ag]|uniref:helical backbone metal receptor n=1 Tax=Frankia sp. ACN1ag TaxID=102891 RepID=UPI0006DCC677|nr:helical backbone metal receptor [Frankia sp. ACN1ag]KQC35491.1 ABC transporter substrate-binding protein [Frankia sp. ACN1ag]
MQTGPHPGAPHRDDLSRDDLGHPVRISAPVGRVVSLVPSLTESIALSAPGLLVGATDWCSHPPGLAVARVRGTKNPDVDAVVALAPDLVCANAEENRESDLAALRAAGLAVWVTAPNTVEAALDSLDRMLRLACGLPRPAWLDAARAAWADTAADAASTATNAAVTNAAVTNAAVGDAVRPGARRRALVPIWRRPWMAVGRDTFAGDVLRRLGVDNVLADSPQRYPRFDPAHLPPHDLVVLPDEPYAFSPTDGPEAFAAPAVCVPGRLLTWYGPSLAAARHELAAALARA